MSTIAELFARDPLKHTDADIDEIISHFRKSRQTFKKTGKPEPKLTEKEKAVNKLDLEIDLGDL